MKGPVIAAVDDSDVASEVVREAAHQARTAGAELLVLQIVTVPLVLPMSHAPQSLETIAERLMARAKALTARLAEGVEPPPRTRVEHGSNVSGDICRIAAKEHASLLVIGAHAHRLVERMLGTTASTLAHEAPCSVLIVREAT
jgi:nucleotide-binding universal stress UspA family protein